MDDLGPIVIAIIGVLCAVAFGFAYFKRSRSQRFQAQAREVEIRIRMSSGIEVAENLQKLAHLHLAAGDIWSADINMEKAVKMAEQVLGTANPDLLPFLSDHLKLMEKMRRTKEVAKLKERIRSLSQDKKFST